LVGCGAKAAANQNAKKLISFVISCKLYIVEKLLFKLQEPAFFSFLNI
jgi:hypothetical protein